MSTLLILFISVCKFMSLNCEMHTPPGAVANTIIEETDEKTNVDQQMKLLDEDFLPDPISSINIDYMNNALILQFRKGNRNSETDDRRRVVLDKNFMRFGRAGSSNLMRFGKRQIESTNNQKSLQPNQLGVRLGRSGDSGGARDSRGDNFMRFGRGGSDFMRFGRAGGIGGPFSNNKNPMRFGRSAGGSNLMRFGRAGSSDSLMRFGRGDKSLLRFGRNSGNLMRFGRSDSFMRLGRTPKSDEYLVDDTNDKFLKRSDSHLMRFGRGDKNFMRFGKLDQNFMRFGKRATGDDTESKIFRDESILSPKDDSLEFLLREYEQNSNDTEDDSIVPEILMAQ